MGNALRAALGDIDREFGKGTIGLLGKMPRQNLSVIPTGSMTLDRALGVGGFPRGRIVEIYGPESSGKTTLTIHAMANAQAQGLNVAFIDAEHAFDPGYAADVGVDIDKLLFSQPDYGEQALELTDRLVKTKEVGLVVVDSVAALTPRAELNGEMGDQTVGLMARMMSQAMRKLAGNAQKTGTTLIFTNQIREKVGVMFGTPETQPGGRALPFFASQRLDVRRVSTNKAGNEAVSNATKVTVKKNKVAPPYKVAEFDIEFGVGVSHEGGLLDVGLDLGLVLKSGSFFSYADERLAQGRDNSKAALKANPELRDALEAAIRSHPDF